jgi:hypothetical protein
MLKRIISGSIFIFLLTISFSQNNDTLQMDSKSNGFIKAKPFYAKQQTSLYSSMGKEAKPIRQLEKGEKVAVLDTIGIYYVIKYNDSTAYAYRALFLNADEHSTKENANKKREELLITLYGNEVAKKIQNKEIWIGMTRQMAIESWGNPTRVNRYGHGLPLSSSEHWLYGSGDNKMYLIFDNDILTDWYD